LAVSSFERIPSLPRLVSTLSTSYFLGLMYVTMRLYPCNPLLNVKRRMRSVRPSRARLLA